MALNLSRWWKYAQAKANRALRDAERELDDLEAERTAQVAERPWLADDAEAPSFDTARARIEWEAARNAEGPNAEVPSTKGPTGTSPPTVGPAEALPTGASEPAIEAARLELDRREREAKDRLQAMRDELGIDPQP
jgi:hypothetical protein